MYKYKRIKLKDGTTRDEHRLVMEKHLGRRLSRNEVVHHIDGDKRNNDLSNLEVLPLSDHSAAHMAGRSIPESTKEKMKERKASYRGKYKLTQSDVNSIRIAIENGERVAEIAKSHNISRRHVYDIKHRRTWP